MFDDEEEPIGCCFIVMFLLAVVFCALIFHFVIEGLNHV